MNPTEKIVLIHKIVFKVLDKRAKENGFENWEHMKKLINMTKDQAYFIEETIRLALNEFSKKEILNKFFMEQ